MKLSAKLLLLALLNVALLGILFGILLWTQFGGELNPLLIAPSREKILSVSRLLERDLEDAPDGNWAPVFERYSTEYGVTLALVDRDAGIVGGKAVAIPPGVAARVRERPPQGHPGEDAPPSPPPRRRRDEERGERPPPPRADRPPQGRIFVERTGGPLAFWVGVRMPVPNPGQLPKPGTLLLASPGYFTSGFFFDGRPWLIAMLAALGVSAICWLPFIRSLTASIVRLSKATEQIAQGHFEIQLPERRRDEIGHLSGSINQLSAQLSRFVTGQKRFLADVAHELCSPIARVQFAIGILERRVAETDREYVNDLHAEIQHMSSLVNELLSFTKMGLQPDEVRLQPVNLEQLVIRAREREGPGDARMVIQVDPAHWVLADAGLLLRALANLMRNALRYAGDSGSVTITSSEKKGAIVLTVTDCGPGLPDELIGQIFEPFRRVDTARTRSSGGVGLGLAIVKSCVEACQGTIQCHNRQPSGLEVEIELKAAEAQ
jgi:two-component system sensor histidine kinase CpxA